MAEKLPTPVSTLPTGEYWEATVPHIALTVPGVTLQGQSVEPVTVYGYASGVIFIYGDYIYATHTGHGTDQLTVSYANLNDTVLNWSSPVNVSVPGELKLLTGKSYVYDGVVYMLSRTQKVYKFIINDDNTLSDDGYVSCGTYEIKSSFLVGEYLYTAYGPVAPTRLDKTSLLTGVKTQCPDLEYMPAEFFAFEYEGEIRTYGGGDVPMLSIDPVTGESHIDPSISYDGSRTTACRYGGIIRVEDKLYCVGLSTGTSMIRELDVNTGELISVLDLVDENNEVRGMVYDSGRIFVICADSLSNSNVVRKIQPKKIASIRYTLDGSEPTIDSMEYTTPIKPIDGMNLKFKAIVGE